MKKRLMIVDDSRVMELQIRQLLEDSDYEVAAYCENGEEAIASYREVLPDIVLTDIIMPGIDGLEAAQVIVEEHPQARVVMMTSLTDDGSLNEADTVGARGFLVKPLTREALLEALDEALQDT